jgi:hypothetical protein
LNKLKKNIKMEGGEERRSFSALSSFVIVKRVESRLSYGGLTIQPPGFLAVLDETDIMTVKFFNTFYELMANKMMTTFVPKISGDAQVWMPELPVKMSVGVALPHKTDIEWPLMGVIPRPYRALILYGPYHEFKFLAHEYSSKLPLELYINSGTDSSSKGRDRASTLVGRLPSFRPFDVYQRASSDKNLNNK